MKETKKCNKCKVEKSIMEFSKSRNRYDGLCAYCKECDTRKAKNILQKRKSNNTYTFIISKICTKCKETKIREHFTKTSSTKDGLCVYCKDCKRKMTHLKAKKNLERKDIIYPIEKKCIRCEEIKILEYFHKNKILDDGLAAYCIECMKNIRKEIRIKNPGRYREHTFITNTRRRERKLKVKERFTKEDRLIIMSACHNCCVLCGNENTLTIDHFYPLSFGNPLCIGNAIVLCKSCNSRKNNKAPEKFFTESVFNEALIAMAVSDILKNGVS